MDSDEEKKKQRKLYHREYYQKNKPTVILKRRQRYAEASKDPNVIAKRRAESRAWYRNHNTEADRLRRNGRAVKHRLTGRTRIHRRYTQYLQNAKTKNHRVEMSEQYFESIVTQPCAYCGEKEEQRGVDRVDNQRGYVISNMASCCALCNYSKNKDEVNGFRTWLMTAGTWLESQGR